MKVLVDANTLISAIALQSRHVAPLITGLIPQHEVCITNQVAAELTRNTLRLRPEVATVVQQFLDRDELIWIAAPDAPGMITHRDKKDQSILDAAIVNEVDIIITGDKGFHALEIERPRIMYSADFIVEFLADSD